MTKVAFVTIPSAIVTQKFNNYNPTMYGGGGKHKGIDFGIIVGTPVYTCMDGVVTTAVVTQSGYGRHVRITHNDNSMSIYGHLSQLMVEVGDIVVAGQQIGLSGGDPTDGIDGDGLSTGAHLHWEIRPPNSLTTDQGAVDPMEWCCQYIEGTRREAEITTYLGLRARHEPSTDGTILYVMPHRTLINVLDEVDGWSKILSLRPEWCFSEYINFTGITSEVVESEVNIYTDKEKLNILWEAHPELH